MRANQWAQRLKQDHEVNFQYINATISLESILSSYPGPIHMFLLQFPDPHFKRRHHKRRVHQPGLVQYMAQRLRPSGWVLLQSDVHELACDMRNTFQELAAKELQPSVAYHTQGKVFHVQDPPALSFGDRDEWLWASKGWLMDNPLGVPTEREHYVLSSGRPVYRFLLQKAM